MRLIHTHLYNEELSKDDLADLAYLRLDSVSAALIDEQGLPLKLITAYIGASVDNPFIFFEETNPYNQSIDYDVFIYELEKNLEKISGYVEGINNKNAALLIGVYPDKTKAFESLSELRELAASAGIEVYNTYYQLRDKVHPKFIIGPGKLKSLIIEALQYGVNFIIFDNTLTATQAKSIGNFTEMKILDRNQLILDIFAKRAKSNDGKLRVELAQLKYLLPRLSAKDDSLSRLTGGIGGRGPGETKLEIDRRRIYEKISFLTEKLRKIEQNRYTQKKKRIANEIPLVSIIGYTNAGKSTLINNLTKTDNYADNLMFATLDPVSKRIRFPEEKSIIINDTVGFIRDLPDDLKGAFKATLEELFDSSLLVHLIDLSNQHYEKRIEAVDSILGDLKLADKPCLLVFNKIDLVEDYILDDVKKKYSGAIFISAINKETYRTLLEAIRYTLFLNKSKENLNLDYYTSNKINT